MRPGDVFAFGCVTTMRFARVLLLVLVAACSPVAMAAQTDPEPSTTCPFGVRGARVELENTSDGVQIKLRAFGDVEEVRRRAVDAAAMYGPGAHQGLGHDGQHGTGERHGFGLGQLGVPVSTLVENTPDGARILVWPKQPEDLDKMRTALAKRESRARAGKCPKKARGASPPGS